MKKYKTMHMIRMEDLNHHENLYAGRAIEWMVEASFLCAGLETKDSFGLLFRNCHKFEFNKSVYPGEILGFEACVARAGKTSLTIHVGLTDEATGEDIAEGMVTFVTVKAGTHKTRSHGIVLDEVFDTRELSWRDEAEGYFAK